MTCRTSLPPLPARAPVVVVGAGYSGLCAALRLHDLGIDALVLEAADRIGGRVLSEDRGGLVVDHGGQWVGPTQKHLLALAERFGCATFPTFEEGAHVEVWRDGTTVEYAGAAPDAGPGIEGYERITAELDRLALGIDLQHPHLSADFEAWDAMSAEEWFRSRTSDEHVLARLALVTQGVWCAEPHEISLFHLLFYLHSAGGYEQLMETRGCAQDSRFADGASAPARAAAAYLGDRVRLGTPVTELAQCEGHVRVATPDGAVLAERVIVTVPPPALERIAFEPALPAPHRGWRAQARMGRVAKVHAVYEAPFWRDRGRSGVATLYHDGALGVVFDNSPHDAGRGVLVGFVYGDRLDAWSRRDAEQRRAAVLADLALVVGEGAASPVDYTEKIWTEDDRARGGYEAYLRPGGWTVAGAEGWRSAAGGVHFAGSETAEEWNGYIDGAISAGRRAAEEVAAALPGR